MKLKKGKEKNDSRISEKSTNISDEPNKVFTDIDKSISVISDLDNETSSDEKTVTNGNVQTETSTGANTEPKKRKYTKRNKAVENNPIDPLDVPFTNELLKSTYDVLNLIKEITFEITLGKSGKPISLTPEQIQRQELIFNRIANRYIPIGSEKMDLVIFSAINLSIIVKAVKTDYNNIIEEEKKEKENK
jgi:hypothetical protein